MLTVFAPVATNNGSKSRLGWAKLLTSSYRSFVLNSEGRRQKQVSTSSYCILPHRWKSKGKTASLTKIWLYRKPVHASLDFNPALSTSKNNAGKVCKVCRNVLYRYLMSRYLSSQSSTCNAISAVTKSKEDPLIYVICYFIMPLYFLQPFTQLQ